MDRQNSENARRARSGALTSTLIALVFTAAALPQTVTLPADLQVDVDRLIAGVEASATDAQSASERAGILWRWVNALALLGESAPMNSTLVAKLLMHPEPGTEASPAILSELDSYVRQLAAHARFDDPYGSITIEAPEVNPALSWQTVRVVYTVGDRPLRQGGRLMVTRHFMATYGVWQTDDPAGDDYLTLEASDPAVRFVATEAPMWGAHGGFRGAVAVPAFRVEGADLAPGETVTITYGDRRGGSRGFQMPEFSNDAVALPVYVDLGDGLFAALPLPTLRVVGAGAYAVHGFAPSIVGVGEEVVVSVRFEDEDYNRATGPMPELRITLDGEPWGSLPAGDDAIREIEARFDVPGVHRFAFESTDGSVAGTANPIWVRDDPDVRIYWGETHGHCGFAEGLGSVDGYFEFARDDSRLDFVTLSEHDIWLDDHEWNVLNDAARRFARDGDYLVFPGYEWTSNWTMGGHHNVFFRRPGLERVPTQEAPVLSALYRGLHAKHDERDVLVIPHAHQAGDWRLSDFGVERLVEIVSGHGTFEWFGQKYLEHGYRVGFVGASDDHLGHPGYAPGRVGGSDVNRPSIHNFGGLAGVYASARTHDAVFDALRARSTYAVSGAERIIVDARLNGAAMGSELDFDESRKIEARVIGTGPIESVALVKNGEIVETRRFARPLEDGAESASRQTFLLGFESDSVPVGRDNPRGQRVWQGTVEVRGARLLDAEPMGKLNRHYDRVERIEGTNRLEVSIGTRGLRHGVLLDLEGVGDRTEVVVELEPTRETGKAPPRVRPMVRVPGTTMSLRVADMVEGAVWREQTVDAYRDRVSLERARRDAPDDVEVRFEDTGEYPGDFYSLRVRQLDGALAWSSPWWVGGLAPL